MLKAAFGCKLSPAAALISSTSIRSCSHIHVRLHLAALRPTSPPLPLPQGLDFPDIQHVINYDMPEEIENYVHRIGEVSGRNGVALAHAAVPHAAYVPRYTCTRGAGFMQQYLCTHLRLLAQTGRTGRCGKTGVATTFINTKQCSETILLDLKHLLK